MPPAATNVPIAFPHLNVYKGRVRTGGPTAHNAVGPFLSNIRYTAENKAEPRLATDWAARKDEMARPRVFVSSTFYDLRQVRADLFRFIAELGYEPVLNERGAIPYDSNKKLQESAYRSVDLSDILVSIIGGRYGTGSDRSPYSISQIELKTALDGGKPVFIFVEKSTLAEYSTYLKNKGVAGIQYSFADNPQIYAFLEEIHALPQNNPIAAFETAQDITEYLKEQWAGLFQSFLQQRGRVKEVQVIESLSSTAETLNQMVKFLSEQHGNSEKAIQEILFSNHPIFQQLREVTRTPYRILFYKPQRVRNLAEDKRLSTRPLRGLGRSRV